MPFQIYKDQNSLYLCAAQACERVKSLLNNPCGTEEHPAPAASSLYLPITVQSIKGEMELMDALFRDVQYMGELGVRCKIWVEQMRELNSLFYFTFLILYISHSIIWKMELRHLYLSETFRTRFPPQPKRNSLFDLQTLWGLLVDEEAPVKHGLDRLVNIRKLGLACRSMSLSQEAMLAQLEAVVNWIGKLEHLQTPRLRSRDEEGLPWILPLKSFEKNMNLTDMRLLGTLSSSAVLSQFPRSLVELTLSHSKLQDDSMQMLKDFPNLQTLYLRAESYMGKTMFCESQSFPQLSVLKFWGLYQLEEWEIEQGALPCLKQLEIRKCLGLKMLPEGLKHVNTLLELKLTNMTMDINAERHKIPPNCELIQINFQQNFITARPVSCGRIKMLPLLNNTQGDLLTWGPEKKGIFSVKSISLQVYENAGQCRSTH